MKMIFPLFAELSKNSESLDELIARHDEHSELVFNEHGEGSTPVFASILRKYYALQQYSIFSKIEEIKSYFVSYGGADKIVMSFQNSLIEFHRPENLEEEEILFFSSSSTKTQKFPNEVVLAAALYLCYVRSTLRGKYCQISEARSELVNALRTKYFFETETMIKISKINLGYETPPIKMMKSLANGRSPTDLGDEDSELSKVIKLKKSFVKFPQKLNFLSAPPKINPDLKYFVDEIPEFFPGLDTYKVYLAASMGLTDENFTEFAKFSMEDRIQFRDEINLILPGRAWTYWQDGIDELFNPHFKIPD